MTHRVRRRALAIVAAVALLLCAAGVPGARATATTDFTAAQRTNTLKVLQAFPPAMPGLGWTDNDFCTFAYVTCAPSSVSVVVTAGSTVSGSLPELPSTGVDYAQVMVKQVDFSGMGERLTGTLPLSWSSLSSIRRIELSSTKSSGTPPAVWSSMAAVQSLKLSKAGVRGTLPVEWSSLPRPVTLKLTNNSFCGCVPASWSAKAGLTVVVDASVTGSTCTTTNSCSVTGACGLEGCIACAEASPSVCGACSHAYFLTGENTCVKYSGDGAAAPSTTALAALVVCMLVEALIAA
ncbi:surface antigen protein 2 [Novymonas esmeraldas]|uniref:Surface antigen protein 2 n=1 Tax=Novymonas esmeraldas TaxID=1808958 RepID=A0AAW0F0H8_9TRYP